LFFAVAGILETMFRFLAKSPPIKRVTRGVPIVGLLSAAEVAKLAYDHLAKLDSAERRRLAQLVGKLRRGPGSLSDTERRELSSLPNKLEPRVFAGSALARFSPVPLPKRLLYGARHKRRSDTGPARDGRT
jgi:hypothetical protein